MLIFRWLAIPAVVMLAGCVFVEPEKVAAMAVPEAPFEQGLFNGYLELSKSRSLQGDRLASSFFASKARTVARGEAIPPEAFETWRLQDDQQNMLIVARARLTSSIAEMDDDDGAEFGARAQLLRHVRLLARTPGGLRGEGRHRHVPNSVLASHGEVGRFLGPITSRRRAEYVRRVDTSVWKAVPFIRSGRTCEVRSKV